MFTLPSIKLRVPYLSSWRQEPMITVRPIRVYDIEVRDDKDARALKYLLKLNHASYSLLNSTSRLHNCLPHGLSSAYILGYTKEHLERIYESEARHLEKWSGSPNEVTVHDWRDFLGDARYQRAYVDFFEDELIHSGYIWRNVVEKYLFQGSPPLFHRAMGDYGHSVIHLACAYELSSKDLAMEALATMATSHNCMHTYMGQSTSSEKLGWSSTSLRHILQKVACDQRVKALLSSPHSTDLECLFNDHRNLVLEFWNAWVLQDAHQQLHEGQRIAASLLVAAQTLRTTSHNRSNLRILTSSCAARVLLPCMAQDNRASLLRQWWLLTLGLYITQGCPPIDEVAIIDQDTRDKSWASCKDDVLHGKWSTDIDFITAIRALSDASETVRDDLYFLKAAVKFCIDFDGWQGSGTDDHNQQFIT